MIPLTFILQLVMLLLGTDESFDRTKTGEYDDTVDRKRVGKLNSEHLVYLSICFVVINETIFL
jgi:hypothetical protein